MHSGGHGYKVPKDGWVTNEHEHYPDLRTGVIDRNRDWRNGMSDIRHFHDDDCGRDWYHHHHGFYCGDAFWFGFDMGMMSGWDWNTQPVYVVSPVTGDDCGVLVPTGDGGFEDQNAAWLAILNTMANPAQDQNDPSYDATAGLYASYDNFDPQNPGQQLSGNDGFAALSTGQPIVFHPPNGDWETISSLDDLNAYLYTQEQRSSAPPQD